MNLNFKQRLFGGFGLILILLLLLGVTSFYGLNLIQSEHNEVESQMERQLFIKNKEIDHLNWVNQLLNSILSEQEFAGELDHHSCSFGEWHYSILESDQFQDLPAQTQQLLQSLEEPHRKLHQSAQQIRDIQNREAISADRKRHLSMEVYNNQTLTALEEVQSKFASYQGYLQQEKEATYQTIEEHADLMSTLGVLLIVVAIGLGLGIAYIISEQLTVPVLKAKEFAQQLAAGKLNIDSIELERKDELGSLITALNKMHHNWQQIVERLTDTIEGLTAYSQELSATSEEGNATIETNNQLIETISASIQQISASAGEVTNYAQEAKEQSKEGTKAADNALASINEVTESVHQTVDKINELDSYSQEINQIVELITKISEEINMLALNASIEAARAGESGQGFAVVAEEIKELSSKTNQAIEDIADLVTKTQNKSKEGLAAVKEVEDKADYSQEIIEQTRAEFNKISDNNKQVAEQIAETSQATDDLANSSDRMQSASHDIRSMSDEIATSAQELAQMTQDLEDLINQFEF
ncbi:MAG: methyl-accepting chemotaxis protein [Bacillota bacterium]